MEKNDINFSFLQILSGNTVLDYITTHRLQGYHYLLNTFIQKSPEEIREFEFLQRIEKGIMINIKETFENLITNVLMAMFSTGTFLWRDERGEKTFFIKMSMPSGIVYRLNNLIKNGRFGGNEERYLRDYLQNPESYEYFRNIVCDHPDNSTGDSGEDHYLLRLSITPYESVFRKFSSFVYEDYHGTGTHFHEDYLSFFTKTIGEIVISDPSIICRMDFHNFLDSFAFSLNLRETEFQDNEWPILKNLDSLSKKFMVNVLIIDFLHDTNFFSELDKESFNEKLFVTKNIQTIEKISNIILGYIWETIHHVFINEGRFFTCTNAQRVAEFMEKSLEISRFVVINWNGNRRDILLPGIGTNWNERRNTIPDRIPGNEMKKTEEMRNQILMEYRDEKEYLINLTEKIWRDL